MAELGKTGQMVGENVFYYHDLPLPIVTQASFASSND
jgi:hypothetical protein